MLWGYPSSPNPEVAVITPWGQLAGAVIMFGVLGLLPGYVAARVLASADLLRIPHAVEIAGLDVGAEVEAEAHNRDLHDAERAELESGATAS